MVRRDGYADLYLTEITAIKRLDRDLPVHFNTSILMTTKESVTETLYGQSYSTKLDRIFVVSDPYVHVDIII